MRKRQIDIEARNGVRKKRKKKDRALVSLCAGKEMGIYTEITRKGMEAEM